MLSLTRKTDYALVALSCLGMRKRDGQGPISAREIADRFELPASLLMNILKELGATGILASTRGSTGGYELAVDPDRVSLMDVVAAIEGPVRLATCCASDEATALTAGHAQGQGQAAACSLEGRCPIRQPIHRLHERITRFLAQVTLADLLDDAEQPTVGGPCGCGSASREDAASLATMPVLGEAASTCCQGRH